MSNDIATSSQQWSERLLKKNEDLLNVARIIAARVELCPVVTPDNPPRARIIGGFVRDALLDIDSLDIDIEVYGTRPLDLFAALQDLFPMQLRLLGKSYQVLQVRTHDDLKIEVNMPRSRWDEDRRCFFAADPYRTPEQAAASREFVCNTAQADPISGDIFDYLNARQEFIDGELRIQDARNFFFNPLCVFRALHFNTRFGLAPTAGTIETMRKVVAHDLVKDIHPRRIADELEKVLHLGRPASAAMKLMRRAGIMQALFPMVDDSQREGSEEIWQSTLVRLDRVQKFLRKSGEIDNQHLANAAIYSSLLFDPLYVDYKQELETHGKSAETTVRRKTNQFFYFLQFEHPTLKRNFPKLMSSLILLYEFCLDLEQREEQPGRRGKRRAGRLKPRTTRGGPASTRSLATRAKDILAKLRPLNPEDTFDLFDLIMKKRQTDIPTYKIRKALGWDQKNSD